MSDEGFVLDPELEKIGLPLGDFALCRVFLFDDARFPWLMLVPRKANVSEIIDLKEAEMHVLFSETLRAATALRAITKPDKLNLGALGNIVRQLHVHVVARFVSDVAWPGPVWGHGVREPYPAHMAGPLTDKLKTALKL